LNGSLAFILNSQILYWLSARAAAFDMGLNSADLTFRQGAGNLARIVVRAHLVPT